MNINNRILNLILEFIFIMYMTIGVVYLAQRDWQQAIIVLTSLLVGSLYATIKIAKEFEKKTNDLEDMLDEMFDSKRQEQEPRIEIHRHDHTDQDKESN